MNLETVVAYIEAILNTDTDLAGKVKFTTPSAAQPDFKDYGAVVYFGEKHLKTSEFLKIGPIAAETFHVNVDVVINRNFLPRQSVSDALGLAHWQDRITSLFFHKNNSGAFKDSWWEFSSIEEKADSYRVKGIFNCTIETVYPVPNQS